MDRNRTIFIVNNEQQIGSALAIVEKNNNVDIFTNNPKVEVKFLENDIPINNINDYFTVDDTKIIRKKAEKTFETVSNYLGNNYPDVFLVDDNKILEIVKFDIEKDIEMVFLYDKFIKKIHATHNYTEAILPYNNTVEYEILFQILEDNSIRIINPIHDYMTNQKNQSSNLLNTIKCLKNELTKLIKSIIKTVNRQSKNQPILFFVYEISQLNQLQPVANEFKKEEHINSIIVLVSSKHLSSSINEAGLNYLFFSHFKDYGCILRTKNIMHNISDNWLSIKDDFNNLELSVDSSNINKNLTKILEFKISNELSDWVKHYYISLNLFEHNTPKVVVLIGDWLPSEKAIVFAAKAKNIPVLIVQHGVTNTPIGFIPFNSDIMAVWGEYSKQFFIKNVVDPSKLHVTGRPLYDSWADNIHALNREEICKRLELPESSKIIILATSALFHHKLDTYSNITKLYSTVVKTLAYFPEYSLIIKLHPAENEAYYIRASGNPSDVKYIKDISLTNLLPVAKILITDISTIGLEAMMVGVPVITLNFSGKPDSMPYASSGAAIGVYRPEDLKEAIDKTLHDEETQRTLEEKRKQFLKDYLYKLDGKASERVARLIEEMVDENQSARDL